MSDDSSSSSKQTSSSSSTSQEESQDPWTLIRSSVSEPDVYIIRHNFFIPDEYEIIIPGPNDRIDEPPARCLSFHVASLEAGLRFPLSRPVEVILTGLDVCPAQLTPKSYRHILGFIILTRFFKVDASFANFCNLLRMSTKTGLEGFFYLSSRPNCKFFHDLASTIGPWKEKFIYVKSPVNSPWRVPVSWNANELESHALESSSWDPDFISKRLTVALYEPSKLLNEELLVLADLSPAPIKTTRSLDTAVRASIVADESHEPAVVQEKITESLPVLRSSSKGKDSCRKRARTEKCSNDNDDDDQVDREKITESPPVLGSSFKGKDSCRERARTEKCSNDNDDDDQVVQEKITESPPVLRSSSKGKDSCRKRARTEKCSNDNDDDDQVVRTFGWLHNAEKIIGDMRKDDDGRDGDYVFKPRQDTLEKFKYTLCDADQLALAVVPLVNLPDAAAHHSLAMNAINHQLLLRAAHSEKELQTYKKKVSEMNQKNEERDRTGRYLQKIGELEKLSTDLTSKNVELKMRLDESNAQLKKGHREFIESEEFDSMMNKAREERLKAFMKSKTFETLVTKRAALHEYQGFSKCLQQATKLAAFRKDFDKRLLDPFKNGKSERDPIIIKDEVDLESEEDEFAYLLKHLDG